MPRCTHALERRRAQALHVEQAIKRQEQMEERAQRLAYYKRVFREEFTSGPVAPTLKFRPPRPFLERILDRVSLWPK